MQNAIKKFIEYLIYSNIWIGLIAASATTINLKIINSSDYFLILFSGSAAQVAYSIIYIPGAFIIKQTTRRNQWISRNKWNFFSLLFINSIAAITLAITKIHTTSIALILMLVLMSILYIHPTKSNIGLRSIPIAKSLTIALCWTILTTTIPNVIAHINSYISTLHNVTSFLFFACLVIPFDIADYQTDRDYIKTLPMILTIQKVKGIQLALIISTATSYALLNQQLTITKSINFGFIPVIILLSILSLRVKPQKNPLFLYFALDGLPILWLLCIILFTYCI